MGEFFKGWRRKAGCVALVIVLAVAAFSAWTRGPTTGLKDAPAMTQAVLAHVPIGTDVEHATKFMEHEGFECSVFTNQGFTGVLGGDREGLDFVYCERTDNAGFLEVRIWGVALVFADGKVTEVLARTGTYGM